MASKDDLRARMRIRRAHLSLSEIEDRGAKVQRRVIESAPFSKAQNVAVYLPLRGEVPTAEIVEASRRDGKALAVPSSQIADGDYRFAWLDGDNATVAARYGIEEPVDPREAALEDIDLVILPGLAFDMRGVRLGQGAGVYDRLLRDFGGVRLGLGFDFQIVAELPNEAHDIAVDYLATESNFMITNSSRQKTKGVETPRR